MPQIDVYRSTKYLGQTYGGLPVAEQYVCDAVDQPEVTVAAGFSNKKAANPLTLALLKVIFIKTNVVVTLKLNGTNAKHTVTIAGTGLGGTFTISAGGSPTAPIVWNASSAVFQAAMELLAGVGAGQILVTGSAGGPWTIEWIGTKAVQTVATITANGAGLTGSGVSITPASLTTGVVPDQTINLVPTIPLMWTSQDYHACPFGYDVANFYLSNPGTIAAVVQMEFGRNGS